MRALTDDLSLAELLEAASRLRRTLTLDLRTAEGTGRIYVSMGDIVHANYGELLGQEAIDSLLSAPELEYSALPDARALFGLRAALEWESPTPPPSSNGRRTMESLDSARSVAVRSTPPPLPGLPPLPHLPRVPPPPPPSSASRVTAIVHRPSSPWRRATAGRPRWMTVLGVVGFSGVLGIGTGLVLDWLGGHPAGAAVATTPPVPPRAAAAPVDAPPEVLRDVLPVRPLSGGSFSPTIVVLLHVGENGEVSQARVRDARAELRDYEEAALRAGKELVFRPALRAGVPTKAWLSWPMGFARSADPPELVRLWASPGIASVLGGDVRAAFEGDSGVRLAVEGAPSGAVEALREGKVDLAISTEPLAPAALSGAESGKVTLTELVFGFVESDSAESEAGTRRPLFVYSSGNPRGLAREFLRFALTPKGKTVFKAHAVVPSEAGLAVLTSATRALATNAQPVERLVFRPASTFLDPPVVAQLRALSLTLKRAGHRAQIVAHATQGAQQQTNERIAAVRAGLVADEFRRLGVPRGLYDVAAVAVVPAPASPTDDAGGFVEVRLTELALATAQGGSRPVE